MMTNRNEEEEEREREENSVKRKNENEPKRRRFSFHASKLKGCVFYHRKCVNMAFELPHTIY